MAEWIAWDFAESGRHDLRSFDPHEMGRLEHREVRLFLELTQLLREQYRLPFWKSCAGAFHMARAAVVFQREIA